MNSFNIILLIILICLISVNGQFGIGKKKKDKQKSAFEQAQEKASSTPSSKRHKTTGGGGNAAAAYGSDAGEAALQAELDAMMADMTPEDRKMMEGMMAGMGDVDITKAMKDMEGAMEEIANMDPVDLSKAMQDVMQTPEMQKMLNDPSIMLEQMRGTGMISDDQIDEYLRNPKKYKKEMKKMTDDMMKMFTDPDAMKGMMDMVQGVGEMLADPEKLEEAIMDIARELEEWETELSGPEKVEAARQQLLSSPDLEDNPVLREVFESKEMRDIIGSKEKWRKTVMEGREKIRMGGGGGEL